MSKIVRSVVALACFAAAVVATPTFIGEGTSEIAKALLQGFVDVDDNLIFSPLGYSAVLAIFAEGAKGDSRREIAEALHFPADVALVRSAYKSVLERLYPESFDASNQPNTPEFKNWFYVYKNYTVEDDLKKILREYYLTEVKSVDRPDDYVRDKDAVTAPPEDATTTTTTTDDEVMVAMQRSMGGKDHFSGMTDSSLRIKGKGSQSQMIIFNGLYFKGEWKAPFAKRPADESRAFYKSEKEKVYVSTIRAEGEFHVGDVSALDCKAIELPYRGERYSLLILVPNARDGLSKLVSDLAVYPIDDVYKELRQKSVDVCLPSFHVDSISKPITSFSKLGLSKVSSIFDPDKADLSGVSKDPGLYVEELVQMVSLRVDADSSSANFLTSSIASMRSNFEAFQINRPFLFFLKDKVDDLIVVNGKIVDPTPKPDMFASP